MSWFHQHKFEIIEITEVHPLTAEQLSNLPVFFASDIQESTEGKTSFLMRCQHTGCEKIKTIVVSGIRKSPWKELSDLEKKEKRNIKTKER